MSFEVGQGGEKGMLKPRRSRLRDRELIDIRSAEMYARQLAGWKVAEIAGLFRVCREHASRQIGAIPADRKKAIRRDFHRGKFSVSVPGRAEASF